MCCALRCDCAGTSGEEDGGYGLVGREACGPLAEVRLFPSLPPLSVSPAPGEDAGRTELDLRLALHLPPLWIVAMGTSARLPRVPGKREERDCA